MIDMFLRAGDCGGSGVDRLLRGFFRLLEEVIGCGAEDVDTWRPGASNPFEDPLHVFLIDAGETVYDRLGNCAGQLLHRLDLRGGAVADLDGVDIELLELPGETELLLKTHR